MKQKEIDELWKEIIGTAVENEDPKYSHELFTGTIKEIEEEHKKELDETIKQLLKQNKDNDKLLKEQWREQVVKLICSSLSQFEEWFKEICDLKDENQEYKKANKHLKEC